VVIKTKLHTINQSIINDLRCPYPLIVIKDTIRVPFMGWFAVQLSEQECFQVPLESKETLAGTKWHRRGAAQAKALSPQVTSLQRGPSNIQNALVGILNRVGGTFK
jgi:hypothetical protein